MNLFDFRLLRRPGLPYRNNITTAAVESMLTSDLANILSNSEPNWEALDSLAREWTQNNSDPVAYSEEEGNAGAWNENSQGVNSYSVEAVYVLLGIIDRYLSEHSDMPLTEDFFTYRDMILEKIVSRFTKAFLSRYTGINRLIYMLGIRYFFRDIAQALLWEPQKIKGLTFFMGSTFKTSENMAKLDSSLIGLLKRARECICSYISAAMIHNRSNFDRLQKLTRLLLIIDLLDFRVLDDRADTKADNKVVWDRLHRRPAILPKAFDIYAKPKIELVREAKVSDLFVVRTEWQGYVAGEIANIMNVLAGESFVQKVKHTNEEETTINQQSEQIQSTEQSEEDNTQTELSKEIDKSSNLQIKAEGSVNVSGSYGTVSFGASAQAGVSASMSESSHIASKISRQLVSKAVSKVESRVREERNVRKLTRTEDLVKHSIINKSSSHKTGIYRWVDRVDRYQIFRYPDRLQLEFEIPEPAEYIRWKLDNLAPKDNAGTPKPPEYSEVIKDIEAKKITRDNYAQLAVKYLAGSVPPPPDEELSMCFAISEETKLAQENNTSELYNVPRIYKTCDQEIKQGYKATGIRFSAAASPYYAHWRNEATYQFDDVSVEGYHNIKLSVLAGNAFNILDQNGPDVKEFAVQMDYLDDDHKLGGCQRGYKLYGDCYLNGSGGFNFDVPVVKKLSVALQCDGAASASVTGTIHCKLTNEGMEEWRNSVYDVLLDAWRSWDQAYRTEQLQKSGADLSGADNNSPERNKEIVQEELKRQVIAWLLDDDDFSGMDAMRDRKDNWDYYNIDKARASAPVIQFMEQAFEWSNLTYILYPYFWARGDNWDTLSEYKCNDPEFVRFLRAGSARIILPARPGFEAAVFHWLMYEEPFMGAPMPVPGSPMYVSIAQEIRDLTGVPEGGEPSDSWDVRMSTPLVWLDQNPQLPLNEGRKLGKPPYQPKDPIL